MSPELSCISPFHKKSWNSGESFFGELLTGITIQLSPLLTHYFLQSKVRVLEALAEIFHF